VRDFAAVAIPQQENAKAAVPISSFDRTQMVVDPEGGEI
jgi:hypothetical protein